MIIFDIGTGPNFLSRSSINDNDTIYCFEPIPEFAKKLKNDNHIFKNFYIIQKAVTNFSDIAQFNIAGASNHNLSSLLNFSESASNNWPGRNDFVITQHIKIETIRLDNFIQQQTEHPISKIDFINLDTNGCDIKVLESMGNYINMINCGTMMASMIPDSIYVGQNSFSESIEFLKSNHFSIINVNAINEYGHQVKIYFQKDEIHSS